MRKEGEVRKEGGRSGLQTVLRNKKTVFMFGATVGLTIGARAKSRRKAKRKDGNGARPSPLLRDHQAPEQERHKQIRVLPETVHLSLAAKPQRSTRAGTAQTNRYASFPRLYTCHWQRSASSRAGTAQTNKYVSPPRLYTCPWQRSGSAPPLAVRPPAAGVGICSLRCSIFTRPFRTRVGSHSLTYCNRSGPTCSVCAAPRAVTPHARQPGSRTWCPGRPYHSQPRVCTVPQAVDLPARQPCPWDAGATPGRPPQAPPSWLAAPSQGTSSAHAIAVAIVAIISVTRASKSP